MYKTGQLIWLKNFAFGNMISKKLDLTQFVHLPLLDNDGNALYVSEEKELELSLKEVKAIAKDIIFYFSIVPKDKVKFAKNEKDTQLVG